MDLLKDAAKNLNLYEVKAYVRKAQNVAMNLTEMESKVREATNNEPWGAPSTANISLIQMLKSFHYIDSKGRDQGINVRNKSKNLIAFLNDDNLIRSERKKARANAKKFGGVSSAAYGGASSMGTGFGSGGSTFTGDDEDFANRVYGDGGVYGERFDDPASAYNNGATGNDNFEEYDVQASSSQATSKPTTSSSRINAKASKKEPQNDLLGDLLSFDGDGQQTSTNTATASRGTGANDDDDDDDFDDFQAAPSQPQKPANLSNNLNNLYNPSSQQQNQAVSGPNYNVNYQASQSTGPAKTTSNNDAFSSLFSSAKTKSKTSTGNTSTSSSTTTPAAAAASVNASNPTSSANDDFFGGFSSNNNSSSNNTKTKPATNGNGTNNTNSGDIDLLSF
ncbi:conserved hypothetical protein [Candida albicans WO-1]|uniref:ENTH domain-containing protein n=1 Tax=Candida albicans (strain WO-1) TaxID=294748 RepID=C4YJI7_CANAW|nr:conserved hypothetical protein [Candida albicans WO-1]